MILIQRETHDTPADVAEVLRSAAGVNRFGEPNYRAVWGQSTLDFIGGKWEDHDANGSLIRETVELRHLPKYGIDRWIIERWIPPESFGSPRIWYSQTIERTDGESVPALGPYPSRGYYQHCFTLEGPHGEFLQLTAAAARHIARAIETSRDLKNISRTEFISRAADKQDREYDSYADSVLST